MQISLCYKTYDLKINLAACKSFYEQTGKDLNYTLLRYLEVCRDGENQPAMARLRDMFGVESFDVIAKMLTCMIHQVNSSIPLEEIEDAMFRVGWMPSDDDTGMSNPWPLVVTKLANDVSEYYACMDKKKVTT